MDEIPIRRALLSASDKTGVVDFARALRDRGVEILSTGGTARVIEEAGIEVIRIEEFTGFPEMLDGRVKTLHPKVHAGILFRRDLPAHRETIAAHGFAPIDLVAIDLYPFEATVARPNVTLEEAIEEIDIGGPAMIRSAAKNHAAVAIVTRPSQYEDVLRELEAHGGATTASFRRRLAVEAYRRTSEYDLAITTWLARASAEEGARATGESERGDDKRSVLPARWETSLPLAQQLRYGENPHQSAGLYGSFLDRFEQLGGKALSYNNLLDLAGAIEVAGRLARFGTACAIIKHSNPCGAAVAGTVSDAWRDALATDPWSASGGIVAITAPIDENAASVLAEHFIEILVAPGYSSGALEILRQKKNRIILRTTSTDISTWVPAADELSVRSVRDGLLVQTADAHELDPNALRVVTRRAPTDTEMSALLFAWEVVRCVKSNAIVYTSATRTLGIGAGQMSRVDSARIAVSKASQAGIDLSGSAVASDAFFPFADGLVVCAEAGATAAIQPGGSVRDEEVIRAADERGIAMVFTGHRHFRH